MVEPEVSLSQIISDREITIEKIKDKIKWYQEEINFKNDQLDKEIIEENVSQLYTLVSYPLNHKKPRHVVKIEIEILKKIKKNQEKQLKVMKELQIEDKAKEEKNASRTS